MQENTFEKPTLQTSGEDQSTLNESKATTTSKPSTSLKLLCDSHKPLSDTNDKIYKNYIKALNLKTERARKMIKDIIDAKASFYNQYRDFCDALLLALDIYAIDDRRSVKKHPRFHRHIIPKKTKIGNPLTQQKIILPREREYRFDYGFGLKTTFLLLFVWIPALIILNYINAPDWVSVAFISGAILLHVACIVLMCKTKDKEIELEKSPYSKHPMTNLFYKHAETLEKLLQSHQFETNKIRTMLRQKLSEKKSAYKDCNNNIKTELEKKESRIDEIRKEFKRNKELIAADRKFLKKKENKNDREVKRALKDKLKTQNHLENEEIELATQRILLYDKKDRNKHEHIRRIERVLEKQNYYRFRTIGELRLFLFGLTKELAPQKRITPEDYDTAHGLGMLTSLTIRAYQVSDNTSIKDANKAIQALTLTRLSIFKTKYPKTTQKDIPHHDNSPTPLSHPCP